MTGRNEKTGSECTLCPRHCASDRKSVGALGFCGALDEPFIARYSLHFYEEPCISGANGSGAIFFCGCNMNCVFCQNYEINHKNVGRRVNERELALLMLELQSKGAHNINLVTPTPHTRTIIPAIARAKREGLKIPIVYNTNGYESVDVIKRLEGLIDVYLPDFKYGKNIVSDMYSRTPDYFLIASRALREMYEQCGELTLDEHGMAVRGVLIRHLVLPASLDNTRSVLDHIACNYPSTMSISLMSQYVPYTETPFHDLNRRLTKREYERAVDYCIMKGFVNVYIQGMSSAERLYTPEFAKV